MPSESCSTHKLLVRLFKAEVELVLEHLLFADSALILGEVSLGVVHHLLVAGYVRVVPLLQVPGAAARTRPLNLH